MAKTDFSSSSPLAGSFLTGLISRLPLWRTVAVGGAVYFILQQYVAEGFLCGVLRRAVVFLRLRFLHLCMGMIWE